MNASAPSPSSASPSSSPSPSPSASQSDVPLRQEMGEFQKQMARWTTELPPSPSSAVLWLAEALPRSALLHYLVALLAAIPQGEPVTLRLRPAPADGEFEGEDEGERGRT